MVEDSSCRRTDVLGRILTDRGKKNKNTAARFRGPSSDAISEIKTKANEHDQTVLYLTGAFITAGLFSPLPFFHLFCRAAFKALKVERLSGEPYGNPIVIPAGRRKKTEAQRTRSS